MRFPIIPCDLCGTQPNLQRQQIKSMLADWKKSHPGRIENIFRAISHVSPSQLADHELFDFINLGEGPGGANEPKDRPIPEKSNEQNRKLEIVTMNRTGAHHGP